MHVIVFSKDRPLQLDGYLASLLHYSGLPQSAVTVLFVEDPAYAPLKAEYPGVQWLAEEGGFHATLEKWVAALPDDALILFGCDDVVFFNPFDPVKVADHLQKHPECAGFSLKLGRNIAGSRHVIPQGTPEGAIVEWNANGRSGRLEKGEKVSADFFHYPFEVMGTVYRAGLIKRMFAAAEGIPFRYRGPNDFESVNMRMLRQKRVSWWRRTLRSARGKERIPGDGIQLLKEVRVAMFNAPSFLAAQDVNMVQDIAKNIVRGTAHEDAEKLKRKYLAGWRMEWRHMKGILPTECFLGLSKWRLRPPEGVEVKSHVGPSHQGLKLAVVIPVHNRRELVLETLSSVRAQTVMPWRVVVVDDGSSDGTADVVEEWLRRHAMDCEVQVLRQENGGVSAARNHGAAAAKDADLLAFLDSDDLWPVDFIEHALRSFTENQYLVAATSDRMDADYGSGWKKEQVFSWPIHNGCATPVIEREVFAYPCSTVFSAAAFERAGGYRVGLNYGEDFIMAMVISSFGAWGKIESLPAVRRQFHRGAERQVVHLSQVPAPEVLARFAEFLEEEATKHYCADALRNAVAHKWRRAGKAMAEAGRLREARRCYKRAIRQWPWDLKARWKKMLLRAGGGGSFE